MNKVIGDLAHAHFFNRSENGEFEKLTPLQINQALSQCGVGLCLSAEEGAMYASVEYLLAGLPVVTTPSLGGRDVFFDDEIALTVEPVPEAVKAGVDEMITRNISPALIRQRTVGRLHEHRRTFISLIQSIYDREGVVRSFAEEWEGLFSNKLLKNRNHLETAEMLRHHLD
jgi:glycosyltransferase involved in cell wall biosynthesis